MRPSFVQGKLKGIGASNVHCQHWIDHIILPRFEGSKLLHIILGLIWQAHAFKLIGNLSVQFLNLFSGNILQREECFVGV